MGDFMEYWELALLAATWAALGALALRRRIDWWRRRFEDVVNFSLSYLEPSPAGGVRLVLRTLLEESASRVWLNEWGVRLVLAAARRTSPERPFLAIEPAEDREQIQRAVLNVLAERFAEAFVARALGLAVRSERFLFGLSWERYGDLHTGKLRVMVVRAEDLERLFDAGIAESVGFEQESHRPRLDTLRELHRLWRAREPHVGTVEIGIPLAAGEPHSPRAGEASIEPSAARSVPARPR